jgi:hypothetical protein
MACDSHSKLEGNCKYGNRGPGHLGHKYEPLYQK